MTEALSGEGASGQSTGAAAEPMVEVRGLRYARGERFIFDGVDMRIERGKVTAIMGPSGTGKTTLLRLIGGQLLPAEGEVHVDGQVRTRSLADFLRDDD